MEILITNEDGSTTKFTEEMAVTAIRERDALRTQLEAKADWNLRYIQQISNMKASVYEFFKERYDGSDGTIECDVEATNELLESIGAGRLNRLFTIKGTVTFVITDVEAESEDEARQAVENEVTVEYSGLGDIDDWDVEVHEVDAQ